MSSNAKRVFRRKALPFRDAGTSVYLEGLTDNDIFDDGRLTSRSECVNTVADVDTHEQWKLDEHQW